MKGLLCAQEARHYPCSQGNDDLVGRPRVTRVLRCRVSAQWHSGSSAKGLRREASNLL